MALMLSTAAKLKPEIRLAEAVSQFEASLPADDKATFGDQRAQAIRSPPDTMDVMRFTARIDRDLSKKTRRCLGPRFTNFLSSAQQFAALGDVVVGGSQNIIACGVWSVVRMSILAMVKHSTFIEHMSTIFMEVGRSSPRYQELAILYSRSRILQANVHEYFIVVVQFCRNMMNFARKSALAQFASSLNSEAMKKTRFDLLRWAGEIESEASILLAKRIEDEAIENSRFRLVSTKFSKSVHEQQVLATKFRILDECSKYDYETTWKQIRKMGNTSLFTLDSAYRKWKMATESSSLLFFGKLGCGKSVMLANMIDDLTICTGQHCDPVVYFFVREDIPESMKARTVIGSLARQILRSKTNFTDFKHIDKENTAIYLSVRDLVRMIRQAYTTKDKFYLVIDGLDQCDHSDKVEIMEFVRQLQVDRWVLVCASFRQEGTHGVVEVYHTLAKVERRSLPDNKVDIEEFVESELARCLRNHTLVLGNAKLILQIQEALTSGSRGMFLWVALQIRTLCTMATDNDIIAALDDLPADLEETYKRILDKVQNSQKKYQIQILRFILAAQQPLVMDEMSEALSVTAGDTNWTATSTINDIETVLMSCGCIIHVDEEERTVRFVHPSVRAYVLRHPTSVGFEANVTKVNPGMSTEIVKDTLIQLCHSTMAEVIVTYLSYSVLETQLSTAGIQQIPASAAPKRIVESVTTKSGSTQRLALKFLAQKKSPNFDLGNVLVQEAGLSTSRKREDLVFQHYARKWCVYHSSVCEGNSLGGYMAQLLPNLLRRSGNPSELSPEAAFRSAVDHNSERLLGLLLACSFQETSVDFRFETRLRDQAINYSLVDFAVCKGNKGIVDMLLPHASQPHLHGKHMPTFAICDFLYRGKPKVKPAPLRLNREGHYSLDMLEEQYMHVCQSGRSILACAVWAGNTRVITALLADREAKSYMDHKVYHVVVREALQTQDATTLRLLRDSGNLRLTQVERSNLIEYARSRGFEEAVPILVKFPVFI